MEIVGGANEKDEDNPDQVRRNRNSSVSQTDPQMLNCGLLTGVNPIT
jgi:hypothetical protein